MTDILFFYVAMFLGVVLRFGVPLYRKIKKADMEFGDTEMRYVITAVVTFFLGAIADYTKIVPELTAYPELIGLFLGFLWGFGGLTLLNEGVKIYDDYLIIKSLKGVT